MDLSRLKVPLPVGLGRLVRRVVRHVWVLRTSTDEWSPARVCRLDVGRLQTLFVLRKRKRNPGLKESNLSLISLYIRYSRPLLLGLTSSVCPTFGSKGHNTCPVDGTPLFCIGTDVGLGGVVQSHLLSGFPVRKQTKNHT